MRLTNNNKKKILLPPLTISQLTNISNKYPNLKTSYLRNELYSEIECSSLRHLVLFEDGEPSLLDGALHQGVGGDDDGPDVLCVGVILVTDLEHQLVRKVAQLDPEIKIKHQGDTVTIIRDH